MEERAGDRHSQHCYTHLQSQRDCASKPRVARNELPWELCQGGTNPERVSPSCVRYKDACKIPSPLPLFLSWLSLRDNFPSCSQYPGLARIDLTCQTQHNLRCEI